MKWCVEGIFDDGRKLFTGTGWTTRESEAMEYEIPGNAQQNCDALHLSICNFDHAKARITTPKFTVVDIEDGVEYSPKPLVANKYFYMREKI